MEGSITTREKCGICRGKLIHDEKRSGLFCKKHPQVAARRFIVRFSGGVFLNFKSYDRAAQELNGLRYKKAYRSFDPADYRKEKPNGFRSLAIKYLKAKETRKSYTDIKRGIEQAARHWEDTNVKIRIV
jgi:hypothetical protein